MRLLKTLIVGIAGYSLYAAFAERNRGTQDAPVKPEPPLQRWEGEGGNVPAANPALKTAGADAEGVPAAASPTRSTIN